MSEKSQQYKWRSALRAVYLFCVSVGMFFVAVQLTGIFFVGKTGTCEKLEDGFVYETESGETGALHTPSRVKAKVDERVTVRGVLPDEIRNDTFVAYYPYHQKSQLYIDGEVRDTYDRTTGVFRTNMISKGFRFIPVDRSDERRDIVIMLTATSGQYTGELEDIYIGDKMAILRTYYGKSVFVIFSGILILCYGLILFGNAIGPSPDPKLRRAYLYLGATGVLAGAWFVLQTGIGQMVYNNPAFLQWMETMMLAMIGYPLLRFVNFYEREYYNVYADIVATVSLTVCTLAFVSFIVGMDMLYAIWIVHLSLFSVMLFMLLSIIGIRAVKPRIYKHMRWIAAGVIALLASAVIEAAVYYTTSTMSEGIFLVIGVMTFMFGAIIATQRFHLHCDILVNAKKENSRIRNAVLSNISHAIHRPMQEIFARTDDIATVAVGENTKKFAIAAQEECVFTILILDGIIDYLKFSADVMTLEDKPYETQRLYSLSCQQAERFHRVKAVDFVHRLDRNMPRVLEGDKDKILNVLRALLAMGFIYTHEGCVELDMKFYHEGGRRGNLTFTVTDTGNGLPQDVDTSKLFVLGRNLDSSGGPELILAVTGETVHAMDGTIRLEPTAGKGVRITVSIPQIVADVTPIGEDHMR